MTQSQLNQYNQSAINNRKRTDLTFDQKITQFPYFGYVPITIEDSEFLMFSNNDDIVAKHYFYEEEKSFEPLSIQIWRELSKISEYIFDVGAFTGVYSLCSASVNRNAKIWGFEPSGKTYIRFVTNVLANQFFNQIVPLKIALGNQKLQSTLKHPAQIYSMASGESIEQRDDVKYYSEESIEIQRGDDLKEYFEAKKSEFPVEFSLNRVELMKIDVEGFEANVIKGMEETIKRDSPTILVECLDDDSFNNLRDILVAKYDYKFLFINDHLFKLEPDRKFVDHSRNVLFYKKEDVEKIIVKYK